MEVTRANKWAADIADYLKFHQPARATALRARIKAITHGESLDDNDIDQLERKVRRIIFPPHAVSGCHHGPQTNLDSPDHNGKAWPPQGRGRGSREG